MLIARGRRRGLTAALGSTVLAALILAGCSVGSTPAPTPAGDVELQFLGTEAPETFAVAIERFEAQNPGITVVYNSVPFSDLNSTVESRLGAGDASIDVYMADEPRVPALAKKGFLAKLDSEQAALAAAVSPQALEAVTWDGSVYSLPISTSSQILFYNRALLDAADITPPPSDPAAPWTFEALIEAAEAAQAAGAEWGFTFQQVDRYYQLQALPESLGGGPGLTGDDLLTPDLGNAAWTDAFSWYGSIFESGVSPRGIDPGAMPDLFANGQVAFWVGNPIYVQRFGDTEGLEYGIAPMPYLEGGDAATPTDGWSLGVSPFSAHQEAALAFVRFMALDDEGTTAWSSGRSLMPANTKAFDLWVADRLEKGGSSAEGLDALIAYQLSETAVHRPRTIGYVVFEEVMNKAFADIRNGSDAAARLADAAEELESAFSRL